MQTTAQVEIPEGWDLQFFVSQLRSKHNFAALPQENGTTLFKFHAEDFESVSDAVATYETAYLPKTRAKALKRIGELGRERAKAFSFGGIELELDLTTESRIDMVCRYLDRHPDVEEIHWDATGDGDFITLDRATIYALFDGVCAHAQFIFGKRKELSDRVRAAENINDPVFAEIEGEWANVVAD
jgi:hypothetical protein